ncbi:serine/threonine-protein kinase par-1-like isoform X1 [Mizuhopecten yessoensis]|uniref:serine/threonine-protein kinase par-1-like isoform X1 n=1 Tax=Mizuhopecten yessoensis TaxID=6573 RepID=UPI000B45E77A|nr:serine/threonine-protein kinase par-1-like isoform X1 [Mizuhopecten yessoensis]
MASRRHREDFDGKIAGLYDMEDTIGRGHFAVVKLARHVFTGEKVAVKVIDKTKLDDVSKAHLFQEVRCMKLVQHPNVVRLYEVIDTQTKLYLILELGDGGDMYDYIMKHKKGLEETVARRYFKQIVEAVSYCHDLHVVHRDLKPENVVFFEKLGIVKVTDFGFSNQFKPGSNLETSCGSLAYSAPEILLGDSYDAPAVDVWSLGVLLYMLVCGSPPFHEASDSETLTMIFDCKYQIPSQLSKECNDLITKMLQKDPADRMSLDDIVDHAWLKSSDSTTLRMMPLILHEHLCEEDHNYLVNKMVEGNIATKEEILQSLEKDMYDHIAATFYLLAERKLKRQHQEQHNASVIRKHSAPASHGHSRPYLEPLALSPRLQLEAKKTRTTPLGAFLSPTLEIPPSPPIVSGDLRANYFVKSLTTSMTLDRKSAHSKNRHNQPDQLGLISPDRSCSVSPKVGLRKFLPSLGTIMDSCQTSNTAEQIPDVQPAPKKFVPISKIQILKSFFERKVSSKGKSGGLDKMRDLHNRIWRHHKNNQKDKDQKTEQCRPKTSIVSSLVSPPGTHPTFTTTSPPQSMSPEHLVSNTMRKYSLIREESIDDEEDSDEMDMEVDLRSAKSAESLDDNYCRSHTSLTRVDKDLLNPKRPLISVASSPQLLNQICEEHESDEEDDYVPSKLHSPRMQINRSAASPEVVRKYVARKKRGKGTRGTSCSSSDASDTDDTEGRSRKDKLKHKFMHRRDSSDHSSDTDGGPSGPSGGNLGGRRGFGGGGGGGHHDNKKDDDSNGGGGNNKDGKHGGGGNYGNKRQNYHHHNLQMSVGRNIGELGINSALSNLSLNSVSSKNSLKYIVERNESDSDEDEIKVKVNNDKLDTQAAVTDHINRLNSAKIRQDVISQDFSKLADHGQNKVLNVKKNENINFVCSTDCCLNGIRERTVRHKVKVKMDINRNNGYCKGHNSNLQPARVQTKCCSVV